MKCFSILVVEVVPTAGKDLIERNELDLCALGAIGGLIENEASIPDAGCDRLHGVMEV